MRELHIYMRRTMKKGVAFACANSKGTDQPTNYRICEIKSIKVGLEKTNT